MPTSLPDLPPLIGQSRPFLELLDHVSRVAPLDRPVLIVGERGTGKELIASRLHFLSRRWDRPFVKLNCATLSPSLIESELFGHEAGAFTGAVRRRNGRFELADRGTLLLDEIAHAGLEAQEKVLRAVEYGEFERVGGSETLRVDVRLIGAANIDLPTAAAAGRFRRDLLDRLAFDVLTLPPLRARRDDVALLAEHFGHAFAVELGWDAFPGFTPAALEALRDHDWPGNVRELKNVVERAVHAAAEARAPIHEIVFDPFASPYRPAALRPSVPPPAQDPASSTARDGTGAGAVDSGGGADDAPQPVDFRARIAETERRLLEQALAAHRFNRRAAARHLGLTYDQLRNQLKKHGLPAARGA